MAGAVLLQEGRPIAYVSHALTSTETRNAQIEKELLAVVFALERFHQYTYAKTVYVESDHKPPDYNVCYFVSKNMASFYDTNQEMI